MNYYEFSTSNETIRLPLKLDIRKIYIEVTTACNYNCITCIRHSWTDGIGNMKMDVFEKILSDLKEFPDVKTIHFGGFGEPLSHPNIIQMLIACKNEGYKLEMITNGSLLTQDVAKQLVEIGLDRVYVSLDGPDENCFAQIRPGASYEEITRNIRILQDIRRKQNQRKPELGIEFVATKKNFRRLPAMRKVVDELGAVRFIVTNVLPYHNSMKDDILYDGDVDLTDLPESPLLAVKSAPNMKLRTWRSCKFVEDKAISINYQGEVSPCYAFMHNYNCFIFGRRKEMVAYSFGNVQDLPLKEIWNQPKYVVFRWTVRKSDYPSCTDCRQADGCNFAQTNEADCWGNQPSCGDCLWARGIVVCP